MANNAVRRRPVLMGPEMCPMCGKVFLAPYSLDECGDHEGFGLEVEP